jgi:hypothetical protein
VSYREDVLRSSGTARIGPYRLADAYVYSLQMPARFSPPLSEAIYDVGVRTLVRLPSKETITAKAYLVISGVESNNIEVHDYFPAFYFDRGGVGRRMDAITSLKMQVADPDRPFPMNQPYRHSSAPGWAT